MMMEDKNILVKNNNSEMNINDWAEIEYKRVILIMKLIEDIFSVNLSHYPELRKSILDTGNFIRRLPESISDILMSKSQGDD
jgi:hypothetical protein